MYVLRHEKPVTLYSLHTLLFIPIASIYPTKINEWYLRFKFKGKGDQEIGSNQQFYRPFTFTFTFTYRYYKYKSYHYHSISISAN